jgi:excisionase family DNA binding protein
MRSSLLHGNIELDHNILLGPVAYRESCMGARARAQDGREAVAGGRMERMATARDLAEVLGVPEHTLAQWRSQGKGPIYAKVGRHVRYDWSDVKRWIAGQKMTTCMA